MSRANNSERHRSVIVRAYGDEPVPLKLLSMRNGVVEVAGEDEAKPLGFTTDIVYPFDDGLFSKLKEAYETGDRGSLTQLWREARPYRSLPLE